MGHLHAFADESTRQRYLVAAVLVDSSRLDPTRRALRALCKPGQRRVHFAKESPARRRLIVSALLELDLRVRIYECPGPSVPARARCIGQLVDDLLDHDVRRLVLETLETQRRADVATIRERLGPAGTLTYEHRYAYEEPLLWAADAAAWCYGAGGDWNRRLGPMVDKAVDLDR
jgi:hypothetical protein